MVPCSLSSPEVNEDLRAAVVAALRKMADVVVAFLIEAAITRPAEFTVMATTMVPSLVGSS